MKVALYVSIVAAAIAALCSGAPVRRGPRTEPSRSVQNPEWGDRISTSLGPQVEGLRIANHLAGVEQYLREADVSSLGREQRQARSRNLDRLHAYWQAGTFPHNHALSDRRTPVFIDEHGTLCAVGYLMVQSGHEDLANRVARTRNLVRVADLADDPEVVAWLDLEGLAIEEASLIQPAYGPIDGQRESGQYDTATIFATGASGAMIAWNLAAGGDSPSRKLAGAFGLGVGVTQMGIGGVGLLLREGSAGDHPDVELGHVVINLVAGAVASVLGVRNLVSRPASATPSDAVRHEAGGADWALSPIGFRGGRLGARLRVRF
jgi:hypothetical protein